MAPPALARLDTTFLTRLVETWRDRDGYDPADFVLTSFTRAAAAVLAGRVPMPPDRIATLHALCYRGLGHPALAETGALRKQWDEDCQAKGLEVYQIAEAPDMDEGGVYQERVKADKPGAMLAAYSLWRITGRTNTYLEAYTHAFATQWEGFKADSGSMDFTDLLETGQRNLDVCPGRPAAMMVDEAQDLNPLQWQIVDQWGGHCERVVIAGDPAQALYGWLGAEPGRLLAPVPPEQRRVLSQSYRLSPAVQQYAESWLSQHSAPMMDGRAYRPRADGEGAVKRLQATWQYPWDLLPLIRARTDAGQTVMLLTSCAYMLGPALKLLREEGIPYHNPYRRRNGAWNPGSPEARAAALAFVTDDRESWWTWGKHLPASSFGGTKKAAAAMRMDFALTEVAHRHAVHGDVPWLRSAILKTPALDYALAIAPNLEEPLCIVGTAHSTKGAEADCVIIMPDLSVSGHNESVSSPAGRDAMIRLFYVGLTRSRGDVILCAAAQPRKAVWWP